MGWNFGLWVTQDGGVSNAETAEEFQWDGKPQPDHRPSNKKNQGDCLGQSLGRRRSSGVSPPTSPDAQGSEDSPRAVSPNALKTMGLDTSGHDKSQEDTDQERLRVQGLEPWTHGLKGRCSAD